MKKISFVFSFKNEEKNLKEQEKKILSSKNIISEKQLNIACKILLK